MIQYVTIYAGPEDHSRVVMLVKDRPDYLQGVLNVPGGKIENGEDPVEAAFRELKEETGLIAVSGGVVGQLEGTKSYISWVRMIVNDVDLHPREGETEIPFWTNPRTILGDSRLMPNLRLIFPLIHGGRKGWHIVDDDGKWRTKKWHTLKVMLEGDEKVREVKVLGMGKDEEE